MSDIFDRSAIDRHIAALRQDPIEGARRLLVAITGGKQAGETVPEMVHRGARATGLPRARTQGYWDRSIRRVPLDEGLALIAAAAEAERHRQAQAAAAAAWSFAAERISVEDSPDLARVAHAVQQYGAAGSAAVEAIMATPLPAGGIVANRMLGLRLMADGDVLRVFAGADHGIDHRSAVGRSVREPPCADAADPLVAQVRQVAGTAEVLAFRCRGSFLGRRWEWDCAEFADPGHPRDLVYRVVTHRRPLQVAA